MGRQYPHYRVEIGRGGKSIHPPNNVIHNLYVYAPYWSRILLPLQFSRVYVCL